MSKIPYVGVDDWQEAQTDRPDQPVILVWFYNTTLDRYMRYRGEFYKIDRSSYVGSSKHKQRWCIAGVWFTDDSVSWMIDNSIAYPFSPEDLMLYQLTWGLGCE